jgi:UDP-3-O-[3-hydroxymyristoyl] glucosamine N-acyltransferase
MITILGFSQAAITADFKGMMTEAGFDVCVQNPEDLLAGKIDPGSEYIISVTRDLDLRRRLIEILDQQELKRARFIHPTCWIDPTATIGPGTFIGPFCTVAYNTSIGRDCLLPPYCLIGHGSTIGDDCLFDPGVTIAGSCIIQNRCKFNLRSSVIDKILISTGAEIGAGSMVTKNIDTPGMYVGTPARRVR